MFYNNIIFAQQLLGLKQKSRSKFFKFSPIL